MTGQFKVLVEGESTPSCCYALLVMRIEARLMRHSLSQPNRAREPINYERPFGVREHGNMLAKPPAITDNCHKFSVNSFGVQE